LRGLLKFANPKEESETAETETAETETAETKLHSHEKSEEGEQIVWGGLTLILNKSSREDILNAIEFLTAKIS
jgi:hypothetical protein